MNMPEQQQSPCHIWSLRNSVAHGEQWKSERIVSEAEKDQWLRIFEADEPKVRFVLAKNRPKIVA